MQTKKARILAGPGKREENGRMQSQHARGVSVQSDRVCQKDRSSSAGQHQSRKSGADCSLPSGSSYYLGVRLFQKRKTSEAPIGGLTAIMTYHLYGSQPRVRAAPLELVQARVIAHAQLGSRRRKWEENWKPPALQHQTPPRSARRKSRRTEELGGKERTRLDNRHGLPVALLQAARAVETAGAVLSRFPCHSADPRIASLDVSRTNAGVS